MNYNYNFSEEIDRRNTNSIKWDLTGEFFPNSRVTPLWVADSDWPTAPEIVEALEQRLQHEIFGYTYPDKKIKKVICRWYKNQYNWAIDPEWVVIINGVVPGINLTIQNLISAEEEVIIQPPVYYPFFEVVRNNNKDIMLNPLKIEGERKYFMDFDNLQKIIHQEINNPGALILCNPHNPVGRVWEKKELRLLAEICLDNDILIISDEIHADFVYGDNKHIPIASLEENFAENIITLNAPTKTFNLAGLKIAYTVIPSKEHRKKFKNAGKRKILGSNIFGYEALKAAYTKGDNWLREQLIYLENNLSLVRSIISEIPDIEMFEPEGTYLVWLDFRKVDIPYKKIRNLLFEEAEIGLEPGKWFGREGKRFYRLNIATPRSRLQRALKRLKKIWIKELEKND